MPQPQEVFYSALHYKEKARKFAEQCEQISSSVTTGLEAKQDKANLSQTIDTSEVLYPSNNAVKQFVDTYPNREKYGLEGDYYHHFGIVESGEHIIVKSSPTSVIIQPKLKLKIPGEWSLTTIDSPIEYTVHFDTNWYGYLFLTSLKTPLFSDLIYFTKQQPTPTFTKTAAWWDVTNETWWYKRRDQETWDEAVMTPIAQIIADLDNNIDTVDTFGFSLISEPSIPHVDFEQVKRNAQDAKTQVDLKADKTYVDNLMGNLEQIIDTL